MSYSKTQSKAKAGYDAGEADHVRDRRPFRIVTPELAAKPG